MLLRTAFALSLSIVLGCASIVSKSTFPVAVDSNPSGANVVVTNSSGMRIYEGRTPTLLTLSAKKGFFSGATYTIEASKEDHNNGIGTLASSLDAWYVGNILFGGLIGMPIVDPATGAMWKLDDRIVVNLGVKQSTSDQASDPALYVLSIDEIAPEYKKHLIRVE